MAEYTFPYIGSIAAVVDHERGRFVGSAARLLLGGRPALVSALHVMDAANHFSGCAFSSGPDQPLHLLNGDVHFDRIRDLAVHWLGSEYAPPTVQFWPDGRIDRSDEATANDFLFVHGFPADRTRFSPLLGNSLFASSLPYGAMQRIEGLIRPLEPHQFAIGFDPSTMRRTDTGEGFVVDPHGMSGSPVWRIAIAGRSASEWRPELCRLVGIVTHWNESDRVLIATRARYLLDIPLP